ncbi:hypothetical protein [Mycolicibacterium lutetiense]|uniref:Uncharacterized protein n=1 Tax=Mycolicibacterium lutetiense TaxID=1641992 RepID=A0ABS4ZZ38_9MYCO|nr:hypothetical protein [Mycolicibacterium lutetiense]MBP2454436.1 hypothetical protein [Mycolicibacterium lutetiense]
MPSWVASSIDAYSWHVVDMPLGGGVLAPPLAPGRGMTGDEGAAVLVGRLVVGRFVVVVVE